jgi:hypothetical protein
VEVMDFNTIQKNDNKPKYLKINSRDLMIPDHAQRKFKQHHGDYLAANWKMDKFKPLDVSFRDGKYWVIDGQHRLYAIKKIKGGDCTVLCYVHYGMTIQDEAEFFLNQLNGIKTILTTDRMRIRFMIGDETVVGMVRGAEKAGFIVDFDNKKATNRITALAALEIAFKALPYDEYIKMLTTLKKAYNGRVDSLCREMILGMALFFQKYYGQFDTNALANTLKTPTTPSDILMEGRSYSQSHGDKGLFRGKHFARAILKAYNKRRKQNALPDIL